MSAPDRIRRAAEEAALATVVDCDVHPTVEHGLQGVFRYMPEAWRERFVRKRSQQFGFQYTIRCTHPNGSILRDDARPPGGKAIASDPAYVITDLIERGGIGCAVLNSLEASALLSCLAGVDESIVLASAFNDYFIDRWLPRDPRFTLAMSVPSQDPAAAAAEIRRLGDHPQVVAIAVPLVDVPLGHRRWWPIFAAAEACRLPIYVHASGIESIFRGAPRFAVAMPDSYIERYIGVSQVAEANITSLVFRGTFDRFPGLRFLFAEFGFLWLLPLTWRMDRAWRNLRREVPWVQEPPSAYVRDRCRFTTQPLDEPLNPRHLDTLLEMIDDSQLCFSTDYPHWDNEMPDQVLRHLPATSRQRILSSNARATLRLPPTATGALVRPQ